MPGPSPDCGCLFRSEPPSRRSESPTDDFQAKPLRQVVKSPGRIGEKARTHARSQPGLRMPDLLPPRAWFPSWLAMELQLTAAAYQLHISSSFVQRKSQDLG